MKKVILNFGLLSLIMLFTALTTMSLPNYPFAGVYKGVVGESYLVIKEKDGEIEGYIYERDRETIALTGEFMNDSLVGSIYLSPSAVRPFVAWQKDSLLVFHISVPDDSTTKIVALSFVKISNDTKIKPKKFFNKNNYPEELVGTWMNYDLELKKETGFAFFKNGDYDVVGLSAMDELEKHGITAKDLANANVNVSSGWLVKNGNQLFLLSFLNGQKMSEMLLNYKIEDNKLILTSQYSTNESVYFKREAKKKK